MTTAWQGEDQEQARPAHAEPRIAYPEILPPEDMPPEESASSRSRILMGWSYAPATYILIGINVAVYLGMVLGGVSPWAPTAAQILRWGANRGMTNFLL